MSDSYPDSGPRRSDRPEPTSGAGWADEAGDGQVARREDGAPAERHEYTVVGGDWQELPDAIGNDLMVINMGPQHPSTHGVLRMQLTLDGERVLENEPIIGYLHTGIEKNLEYRPWVQGVTFVTRMDYLSPLFNELGYCLAVEKLLGITDQVPDRANVLRIIVTELNRLSSHFVWLATGGMELGSTTAMIWGFRERESVLDLFEEVSGLRMNHAFIRPGGLSQDVPENFGEQVNALLEALPKRIAEFEDLLAENPIWIERNKGVSVLPAEVCLDLGVTGPILRSAGMPYDVRKTDPYCGIDRFDFDVITAEEGDAYARFEVRLGEMRESLKIIEQALEALPDGPVMVEDKKIGWPAQLALGPDGIGNAEEYIDKIMGQSMEALIHHFKLVTEGFSVPPGQVYVPVESPRGELGYHVTSEGTNKPYRVRVRDPSFIHIGALPAMTSGLLIADVIAAVASVDPVMGGVDR